MSDQLEAIFENLKDANYKLASPQTRRYNCIAFAAGQMDRWWWPVIGAYWPPHAPREETLAAFVAAFQTLGYAPCEDGDLEVGFEKVVIYVDNSNTPTHMARQLRSGVWVSKCGGLEDIEHATPSALEGKSYGTARHFLKRPYSSE